MNKFPWMGLKKGDIVDVVAPGWATEPEAIPRVKIFLESWGLVPRVAKDLLQPHFLGSNTHEYRSKNLIKALKARDSKMIWCLRGGYGSIHLLPALQKIARPHRYKLIWGISDITSLHGFVNQQWKWPSFHGPLLDRMASGKVLPPQMEEVRQILFGETEELRFSGLTPLNSTARKKKKIQGQIIGGNLTVFQSLIGTPWQPRLKNRILFFEDIGERAYRVDRMLEQLDQIGELKQAQALIFGDFMGGLEKDGQDHTSELMQIWADRLKIPVIKNLPAGHGEIQRPVPFLRPAEVCLGEDVQLKIEIGLIK